MAFNFVFDWAWEVVPWTVSRPPKLIHIGRRATGCLVWPVSTNGAQRVHCGRADLRKLSLHVLHADVPLHYCTRAVPFEPSSHAPDARVFESTALVAKVRSQGLPWTKSRNPPPQAHRQEPPFQGCGNSSRIDAWCMGSKYTRSCATFGTSNTSPTVAPTHTPVSLRSRQRMAILF